MSYSCSSSLSDIRLLLAATKSERMPTLVDYTNSILLSHYHHLMSTDNTAATAAANRIWNPAFTESDYEKRLKILREQHLTGLLARAASLSLPTTAATVSQVLPPLPNLRHYPPVIAPPTNVSLSLRHYPPVIAPPTNIILSLRH